MDTRRILPGVHCRKSFLQWTTLASAAQIIVVTLNYRLGIVYVPVKPFKSENHFQISNLHVHVYRILKKYFKGVYKASTLTISKTLFKLEHQYISTSCLICNVICIINFLFQVP